MLLNSTFLGGVIALPPPCPSFQEASPSHGFPSAPASTCPGRVEVTCPQCRLTPAALSPERALQTLDKFDEAK